MKREEYLAILEEALHHYGPRHQMIKTLEECGELAQSLAKYLNDKSYYQTHILEELADVHIMAHQLALFFGMEQFDHMVASKVNRLKDRLKQES